MVDGNELGAVGERGLDLDVIEHLRDTVHHLLTAEHIAATDHEFGDLSPVTGTFQNVIGDQRDSFRMVQPEPTRLSSAREIGCVGDE